MTRESYLELISLVITILLEIFVETVFWRNSNENLRLYLIHEVLYYPSLKVTGPYTNDWQDWRSQSSNTKFTYFRAT